MNFYVDSGGAVIATDPERIFQGSANANVIRFIGAFAHSLPVTLAFKLPNGVWTTPQMMTSVKELTDVQTENGVQFNVWEYTIPQTVTEYYGTVSVQFFVHGSVKVVKNEKSVGAQIASASSSFTVEKGVPITLPDPSDDYDVLLEQILGVLSQLQQADSEGALSAQKSAEAAKADAEKAATQATVAYNKAVEASGYKTAAETAAQKAEAAATTATNKAAEAGQYASAAEQSKDSAAGYANASELSKDEAEKQANIAKGQAEIATTQAQRAASSATSAGNFANSAMNQATVAYGHATDARASKTAAETAAQRAEAAASETEKLYHYRGSVSYYADLPTSGVNIGDVYNVVNAYGDFLPGTNFAWNGELWDALGGSFDASNYAKKSDLSAIATSGQLADAFTDANHLTVSDSEKAAWNAKQNALTFDEAPTAGSTNPVTSGGVKTAFDGINESLSKVKEIVDATQITFFYDDEGYPCYQDKSTN